jgi:general secretion pathway protein N
MKKKIVILSGLFLVLLVAMTPAKLIEYFMPPQNNLVISGVDGSIWSGQVRHAMVNNIALKDIEFSISPLSLVLFSPKIDLEIASGDVQGEITLFLNGEMESNLRVESMSLELAAELLEAFSPVKGVELRGTILTRDLDFTLENKKPALMQGQVHWQNAIFTFNGQRFELGDFLLTTVTDTNAKTITGEIGKTKNIIGIEGNVVLTADGSVEISGSIPTDIDQTIYRTLALFNNGKVENGRLPIRFKQKLF